MGLLDRVNAAREEQRAVSVPWTPWASPYVPFSAGGPAHPSETAAGVEASLRLAPLFAGARLLADMVASLPLQQYRKVPGGKPVKLATSPLLDQPAAYGTLYDWLFQAMTSLVLQGNAYGLITGRDGYQYPTGIEWLPAERVQVQEDEMQPWNPARARFYFYGSQLRREDLFHIRAFTIPGKVEGLSPLKLFMTLIGAGNDALEYGASWYRAGGWPPGTFENTEQEVDKDAADEIRRRLTNSIKRREPLVHGRDWKYTPIAVPPNEAQFIEAQQMSATQIAAILGIPPERIGGKRGDSLTYSTQEQESISLVVDTLRPWLVRIETALFRVLPVNCYVRFNTAAMLKTTTQQRHEIFKLDRDMGLLTVNEIREIEELQHMASDIGDDPIPLQVLVGMARGIKEIPKSFEELVSEGPADKLARLAEAEALKAKLTGPGPAPSAVAPAAPVVQPVQAPEPTGQQSRSLNGKQPASQGNGHG